MSVVLEGLNGARALDFMGALGILAASPAGWKMSWRRDGVWHPELHGPSGLDEVVDCVVRDAARWADAPALQMQYGGVRDLKPSPEVFREILEAWMALPWERGAAMATSYGSELVTDGKGTSIKATAFLFTAGKQRFLEAVLSVHGYVDRDRTERTLCIGGQALDGPKALNWDGATRDYALRASDPSRKKLVAPVSEWLGYRGLALLPTAASRGRLVTACVLGGWKRGQFRWPLWTVPATRAAAASLLAEARLSGLSAAERQARGIGAVFSAAISRSAQGGYGAFSPSVIAAPTDDP